MTTKLVHFWIHVFNTNKHFGQTFYRADRNKVYYASFSTTRSLEPWTEHLSHAVRIFDSHTSTAIFDMADFEGTNILRESFRTEDAIRQASDLRK